MKKKWITSFVLKFDKSKEVTLEQKLNILSLFITLKVSKLFTNNDVKDKNPLNIFAIFFTSFVFYKKIGMLPLKYGIYMYETVDSFEKTFK